VPEIKSDIEPGATVAEGINAFWEHMGLAEDAMRAGHRAIRRIEYLEDADTHMAAEEREDLAKDLMGYWAQATAHATLAQAYAASTRLLTESGA
jgi:hypothetical protein